MIREREWAILVHAKHIELIARATLERKEAAQKENGEQLRAKAKKLMDELEIPLDGPV